MSLMFVDKCHHVDFANRIPNRLNQVNLLVMRDFFELREPIDDLEKYVWWKIEWRQCETDVDDVWMSPAHQSNAQFRTNSIEGVEPSLLSFRFLNKSY